MKKILISFLFFLGLLASLPLQAQVGVGPVGTTWHADSTRSRIEQNLPNNTTRAITAAKLRYTLKSIVGFVDSNFVNRWNHQTVNGQKTFTDTTRMESAVTIGGNGYIPESRFKFVSHHNSLFSQPLYLGVAYNPGFIWFTDWGGTWGASKIGITEWNRDLNLMNMAGGNGGLGSANMRFGVDRTNGGDFIWQTSDYATYYMRLKRITGNLLLGSTVDDGNRLQVTGNTKITGNLTVTGTITGTGIGGGVSATGSNTFTGPNTFTRNVTVDSLAGHPYTLQGLFNKSKDVPNNRTYLGGYYTQGYGLFDFKYFNWNTTTDNTYSRFGQLYMDQNESFVGMSSPTNNMYFLFYPDHVQLDRYTGASSTSRSFYVTNGVSEFTDGIRIGTSVNAGYKMDVNGTSRFTGNARFQGTSTYASSSGGIELFNTADETTNFEKARMYWSGNTFNFRSDQLGTGISRNLALNFGSSEFIMGLNAGASLSAFEFKRNNTSVTRLVTITSDGLINTNSIQNVLSIVPTVNQTSTAGYRGIFVSPNEVTTGSGEKLLMDLGTNSAANGLGTHTSKFKVDNNGDVMVGRNLYFTYSTPNIGGGNGFALNSVNTRYVSGPVAYHLGLSSYGTNNIQFASNSMSNSNGLMFGATGNWLFGNNVYTDAGYKVDVAGTFRSQGLATFNAGSKHSSGSTGIDLYNTTDETTNYERAKLSWNGNIFTISSDAAGTGTLRRINLIANSSTFTVGSTLQTTGFFNFSRGTGSNGYSTIGVTGSFQNSTGMNNGLAVLNNMNMTGTGGFRGIWGSFYDNSSTTGEKILIDLGLNSATDGFGTHTSKYKVDHTGSSSQTGDVELTTAAKGVILKTPDGTKRYRLSIDNAGNIITTLL